MLDRTVSDVETGPDAGLDWVRCRNQVESVRLGPLRNQEGFRGQPGSNLETGFDPGWIGSDLNWTGATLRPRVNKFYFKPEQAG